MKLLKTNTTRSRQENILLCELGNACEQSACDDLIDDERVRKAINALRLQMTLRGISRELQTKFINDCSEVAPGIWLRIHRTFVTFRLNRERQNVVAFPKRERTTHSSTGGAPYCA